MYRDSMNKSIYKRSMMNTAEYIVKRLEELGVTEFFGFPDDSPLFSIFGFSFLLVSKSKWQTAIF